MGCGGGRQARRYTLFSLPHSGGSPPISLPSASPLPPSPGTCMPQRHDIQHVTHGHGQEKVAIIHSRDRKEEYIYGI